MPASFHPGSGRGPIGYGESPPHAPCPDGARIAVNFWVNFEEGGKRTVLTIGLRARLIGRPGRIGALHRSLDHMTAQEGVWIARRGDIARAWAAAYPAPGA